MLGAFTKKGIGAQHPQGRRRFDRYGGGDPARLLQYRFMLGAMLAQPYPPSARRRPEAAQLRPDAIRYRPVPQGLRELPRHRGSPAGSEGFLPIGAAERPVAGEGSRLARGS